MALAPFRYTVDRAAVERMTARLAESRWPPLTQDPEGRLGIPPADLRRLAAGLSRFNPDAFEARVNRHPAFVCEQAGEQLHFIHVRSPAPDAIPLLLMHGWPGSVLEFGVFIAALQSGPLPFHVVAPSLPGYGFSSRSLERDCGPAAIADICWALMVDLGYERFLVQGGDWGAIIGSELARRRPEHCLGLHLNLVPIGPPPEGDPARTTIAPEEADWPAQNGRFMMEGSGYQVLQATRPQTLSVALADSPLGLLAWIGEKFLAWSGRDAAGKSLVSDEAILDHVVLYWLTETIGTSTRLYRDAGSHPSGSDRIEIPTGIAIFPSEIIKPPRAWVERRYNVAHWSIQPHGGHFAALEAPDLLAADLTTFAAGLAG